MNPEIKQRIEQIKNGKVPEGYRYSRAGFSPNDWDKGSLSDVLYNEQRAIPKPNEGYWRIGIRSHAKGTFHEYVENPETVDMDELYVVKENDLILNITFAWEHAVALADKDDDGLLVSHRFPTYVFREGQNPVFYKSVAVQKRFKEMLGLISPGGAGRNRVMSKKDFLRLPCNIPSSKEQQKIAEILMQCDKVIELYEKEIEELQKLKKIYLKKMFPKKGETAPEFRVAQFTDLWRLRKLKDCCEMYNGDRSSKYPNEKDMVTDGIPFINAGDLEEGRVNLASANKITKEKYQDLGGAKLQIGDIVYCLRGTLGKNAYIDNFTEGTIASSLVAIRPKNIDGRYLFHVLNSDIEYRQRIVHDEGAAQPNLSAKNVSSFIIPVPTIEEQKVISSFLDNLINLITMHQRKLDEKKKYKKSLMQLLLTGIVRVQA